MSDSTAPQTLAGVTEPAGFTASDVAFVSGLDESTVSRLWDDPRWLDRVSGKSLQALVAGVPGVAYYFASYSVATRRDELADQLEAEGLEVNRDALGSTGPQIPDQYVINALAAARSVMRGDHRRAAAHLARFWGLQQNHALELLYATSGPHALLRNPERLVAASVDLAPKLTRKSYSFHSILAIATFAHHSAIATGSLDDTFRQPVTDRQSAFMARSGVMGLLINADDISVAERYGRMVNGTPVLAAIEEWSFPTYVRDCRPNSDFTLPPSLLLRRTAKEVLHEIASYPDAYVYYLCSTYIPLALKRDPTFGLELKRVGVALEVRAPSCVHTDARKACLIMARKIRETA